MEKSKIINVDFDQECDILYVTLKASPRSIGREFGKGVWVFYDAKDKAITGVNIFDFSKKLQAGNIRDLKIPVEIDFFADIVPVVLEMQSKAH